MKKFNLGGVSLLFILLVFSSCKKYLDVVPDNVATIDNAFTMRTQAEKYLFTCYSYMPREGDMNSNPAINGGDELWRPNNLGGPMFEIARGLQNKVNPYAGGYWSDLYRGLHDCNIFLENINKVPDLRESEKRQWIAEVKFLKAYYHFYLVRMYGPIPLAKANLPTNASTEETRVSRDPVDDCFNYITQLIDEATPDLLEEVTSPGFIGRITQPIALSFKAKALVTAASPLFNGNTDQSSLRNRNGVQLFNPVFSKAKWDSAAVACKRAIDMCEQTGFKLYKFTPAIAMSPTMVTQLSIRNSLAENVNSNPEVIWANTQTNSYELQRHSLTRLDPLGAQNTTARENLSPTLKIAEMFYSKDGVPINEDKNWSYAQRFDLHTAGSGDKLYIKEGYTTARLHFDREPRFYASLGFDGGIWYGQGRYNENDPWYVEAKFKQRHGKKGEVFGTVTGYWPKKLVHYQDLVGVDYFATVYKWPLIRLADLYLLYAEALNESEGPGVQVYKYINLVRERAGLKSVEESWTTSSVNPTKYTTQGGMRDIIRSERLNELVFESHRFWDLRRWKEASREQNKPIKSWNLLQEKAEDYYIPLTIFPQTFGLKDYFWPISELDITVNPNLVQNLGW